MNKNKRIVLVAAIGVSPAVLTETVWAMAHSSQPVVPNKISVVTTGAGKKAIEEKLFSGKPSVWEELLRTLKAEKINVPPDLRFGRASIVVVPDEQGNEAYDLRSSADNLRAADKMLDTIRMYTEDPQTVVYASIAGGRKSMSALMLMCMSLLGRIGDHATHVLTKPDVIGMTSVKDGSEFYFPKKGHTYEFGPKGERKRTAGAKITIEMFDVPFVRMRGLYKEKFREIPHYGVLVNEMQQEIPPAGTFPLISIDLRDGIVRVGNDDCPLGKCGPILLYCYMTGAATIDDLVTRLNTFRELRGNLTVEEKKKLPRWIKCYFKTKRSGRDVDGNDTAVDEDDVKHMASDLRSKLSMRLSPVLVERLCPKYNRPSSYPKERMKVLNASAIPWF